MGPPPQRAKDRCGIRGSVEFILWLRLEINVGLNHPPGLFRDTSWANLQTVYVAGHHNKKYHTGNFLCHEADHLYQTSKSKRASRNKWTLERAQDPAERRETGRVVLDEAKSCGRCVNTQNRRTVRHRG